MSGVENIIASAGVEENQRASLMREVGEMVGRELGPVYMGQNATVYVPAETSEYYLRNGNLVGYKGIVAVRVVLKPSARHLGDYSHWDARVEGVGMGAGSIRARREKSRWRGWTDSKPGGGLTSAGIQYEDANPADDGIKTAEIAFGAGGFAHQQLKVKVNLAGRSVEFEEIDVSRQSWADRI